jgi:hypothetical protein
MQAKIRKRLKKLGKPTGFVTQVLSRVATRLDDNWQRIVSYDSRTLPDISSISFDPQDTSFILPRLDAFIAATVQCAPHARRLGDWEPEHFASTFDPESALSSVDDLSDIQAGYYLASVEQWVFLSLSAWANHHAILSEACLYVYRIAWHYVRVAASASRESSMCGGGSALISDSIGLAGAHLNDDIATSTRDLAQG